MTMSFERAETKKTVVSPEPAKAAPAVGAGDSKEMKATAGSTPAKASTEVIPKYIEFAQGGGHGHVKSIVFAPDSSFFVTGTADKHIHIWNPLGVLRKAIRLPYLGPLTINGVNALTIHPSGKFIISANYSRLQKWSVDSGELVQTFRSHKGEQIAISPDGSSIICNRESDSRGVILDFKTGSQVRIAAELLRFLAITSDGLHIVGFRYLPQDELKRERTAISVIDFKTGVLLKELPVHSSGITKLAITSDNNFVVSGYWDSTIRIWDIKAGTLVRTLEGHSSVVLAVAITPDNRFIISGGYDSKVIIWDFKTGKPLKTIEGKSGVSAITVSPDGRFLVAGDWEGAMRIWDLPALLNSLDNVESKSVEVEAVPEIGILKNYLDVLADPSLLSLELLQQMFGKVKNIEEYKLSYTLANIELRRGTENKPALQKAVYSCLEKLAATCMIGPSRDEKASSSKQGSLYIAQYKLALDAAVKKGFITKAQQYYLDNQAEDNKTFSDERFIALQQEVEALKKRVEKTEQNVTLVAEHLNGLKKSLAERSRRNTIISFAKMSVGFIAGPLIDLIAGVFDYSDVAEMGAALLKTDVGHWHDLVSKGADKVKENMDSVVESGLGKMGYDPNELVEVWVQASVTLSVSVASAQDTPAAIDEEKGESKAPVKPMPEKASKAFAIKNTQEVQTFKEKLTGLMKHEDGGFTFQLKRLQFNCLQLQFTAADSILMDPADIRKELTALTKLFKQAVGSLEIKPEDYKVELNWKEWALTVTAEPVVLEKIATLLHQAGAGYFQTAPQAKAVLFGSTSVMPSTAGEAGARESQPVVTCVLQ